MNSRHIGLLVPAAEMHSEYWMVLVGDVVKCTKHPLAYIPNKKGSCTLQFVISGHSLDPFIVYRFKEMCVIRLD